MISTTLAIHDASPTDVPPNFITRSGFSRVLLVRPWAGCGLRAAETGLEAPPFEGGALRRSFCISEFTLRRIEPPRHDPWREGSLATVQNGRNSETSFVENTKHSASDLRERKLEPTPVPPKE